MNVIAPISVGIIAIAFCILVYYVIKTLKSFSKSLEKITATVDRLEGRVEEVTIETSALLKKVNRLTDDWQEKSTKLNKIVDSSEEIANTIHAFNDSLDDISTGILKQIKNNQDKIAQVIQLGKIVLELKEKWSEIKQRKQYEKIDYLQTTGKEAE